MRGAIAAWVEDDIVAGGIQRPVGFPGKLRIAQHLARQQLEIPQLKFTAFRWPVHVSRLPFNDCAPIAVGKQRKPYHPIRSRENPPALSPRAQGALARGTLVMGNGAVVNLPPDLLYSVATTRYFLSR